jgi:phosphoenolpyruvate-protein phosphotransferase
VSQEFSFRFPLSNGLHARPASHLAEMVGRLHADVAFANLRNGATANARSVLALVATDTRLDDPCMFRLSGADSAAALAALRDYLCGEFVRCDEPLLEVKAVPGAPLVSRALRAAGLGRHMLGQIACPGLGEGLLVIASAVPRLAAADLAPQGDAAHERVRIGRALAELRADYARSAGAARGASAAVLQAHLGVLNDPALLEKIDQRLGAGGGAAGAVASVIEEYVWLLGGAESFYIRERVLDLEDIGHQLLAKLCGPAAAVPVTVLTQPSVLAAERLTPRQLLALDREHLRGLVLGQAGHTSHTVILARSFNIPTLTGVAQSTLTASAGAPVVVDAQAGLLVLQPGPGVCAFYAEERAKLDRIAGRLERRREQRGETADGRHLEIGANIASDDEAAAAFARGAEGIGLFRTELLFADRSEAPDEEEQYQTYSRVLRAAAGRPVIIRTFDIGGDKPVRFLPLASENNPFLGCRGLRLYARHPGLIRTQLRALWRAARHGPLRVLVPMAGSVEEARAARKLFLAVRDELRCEGTAAGEDVAFGLMLEVPSVAFLMPELCAVADFFSVGTNDLAQYFMAADRENEQVSPLQHPLHPAFLRVLRQLVDGAHNGGRWIGLCGEMADHPAVLPLLVALGFDEISLVAARILPAKAALARLHTAGCRMVLEQALRAATRAHVERSLSAGSGAPLPMLTPALVLTDLDCTTKEQVLRALANALEVDGRTGNATAVEEALWRREEAYSTGFGDGFALPHCKSADVSDSSIAIARLRQPVAWSALDGKPVDIAILLVVRAADHGSEHMRSLARLSRLVTEDSFRARVRAAASREELARLVNEHISTGAPAPTPLTPTAP